MSSIDVPSKGHGTNHAILLRVCADRTTPRENKVHVNMYCVKKPAHERSEHCEKRIVHAWQTAGLSMMAMAFMKMKLK